jgi:hypothetical protein
MPFLHFRPEHDTRVDDLTDPIEWEDNAISNALAAASFYLTPGACQTPTHWTSRLTNYLFTSCPCCSFFRGAAFGAVFATLPLTIIIVMMALS